MTELPAQRPSWIRVKRLDDSIRAQIRASVGASATVCQSANCPNIGECWARGTATYMIMGHTCTRNCAFCDVPFGRPEPLDPAEPARIAASVEQLGLKYVVMTCVDRDDLADSGAEHWVATIEAIRNVRGELVLSSVGQASLPVIAAGLGTPGSGTDAPVRQYSDSGFSPAPREGMTDEGVRPTVFSERPETGALSSFTARYIAGAGIEILTGDFKGDADAIASVVRARPDVFAHNVETVPRLQKLARHKATWERSVRVLRTARAAAGHTMFLKTGMMLGLGESDAEVREAMHELREAGLELLTLGQYLRPRNIAGKLEMQRWVSPDEFAALAEYGHSLGYTGVAASPLTRSSHLAETLYAQALARSGA